MEQESRAGCILHGCGVLAALAGLCAASGAACVFALTPGWRVWALPVFFLLALAGAACRPAAVRSGQRAADTL